MMSLNDEECMVRPNLINLNPVELKYYPFIISLIAKNICFATASLIALCTFKIELKAQ